MAKLSGRYRLQLAIQLPTWGTCPRMKRTTIGQKTPSPEGQLSAKRYSMKVKKAMMKNSLNKSSSNRNCQTNRSLPIHQHLIHNPPNSLLPHHPQKLNSIPIQSFAITHRHHNNLNLYSNLLFTRNL